MSHFTGNFQLPSETRGSTPGLYSRSADCKVGALPTGHPNQASLRGWEGERPEYLGTVGRRENKTS